MAMNETSSRVQRRSAAQSFGKRLFEAASVISRTVASAGELLVDSELRWKGTTKFLTEAQKGVHTIQKGLGEVPGKIGQRLHHGAVSAVKAGGRPVQIVQRVIAKQLAELQRYNQLSQDGQPLVDIQIGPQVYEDMPQEMRSRLWYVILENTHLVEPLRPLHRPHSQLPLRWSRGSQPPQSECTTPSLSEVAPAGEPPQHPTDSTADPVELPSSREHLGAVALHGASIHNSDQVHQNVLTAALSQTDAATAAASGSAGGGDGTGGLPSNSSPSTPTAPAAAPNQPTAWNTTQQPAGPLEQLEVLDADPQVGSLDCPRVPEQDAPSSHLAPPAADAAASQAKQAPSLSDGSGPHCAVAGRGSTHASASLAQTGRPPAPWQQQCAPQAVGSGSSKQPAEMVLMRSQQGTDGSVPGVSGRQSGELVEWELVPTSDGKFQDNMVEGQLARHLIRRISTNGDEASRHAMKDLKEAMSCVPWPIPAQVDPESKFATLNSITLGQEEVDEVIYRDINRTFPEHPYFGVEEGQMCLFRILKAYSLHDLEVGYCQGMAFVAGILLMYLPQEPAFRLFCQLMSEEGPNMRRLYLPGLDPLKVELARLEHLLAADMPDLHAHLREFGIPPVLYASQWLLTSYSCPFPHTFAARVLDIMLQDDDDKILQRIAIAIMRECRTQLLELDDFEAIITCLKVTPVKWPLHQLRKVLNHALASPVSDEELQEALERALEETKLAREASIQRHRRTPSLQRYPSATNAAMQGSGVATASSLAATRLSPDGVAAAGPSDVLEAEEAEEILEPLQDTYLNMIFLPEALDSADLEADLEAVFGSD